jgi:steroid delta-isomerase-like uncharacterized protein
MSADLYRRTIEAISRGDADALDALLAPDIVDHNPIPGQPAGRDGFKHWMHSIRSSFPDLDGAVEDVVAEGDRVAGRVTWRGTQAGPFAGAAPTGRPICFTAIHIVRFEQGRIAEWWGAANLLDALRPDRAGVSPGQRPE